MKNLHGTVVAAFGRQYEVRLDDGEILLCFPRGKKSLLAVGDRLMVERTSPKQGVVVAAGPRRSLLYRSDQFRQKLIAANVSQLILVTATEPAFSTELLSRCIAAAESQDMKVAIILNKADLADKLPAARAMLNSFRALGYPLLEMAALEGGEHLAQVKELLKGETSVLVGQSGMGKSTLINALIPDADARTREISEFLDSGKHTTTFSRLYQLDETSALIDCPGVQEFGLAHMTRGEVESGFPEFRPFLGRCRFRDCHHDREPDCAIKAAIQAGSITSERFAHFMRAVTEASKNQS